MLTQDAKDNRLNIFCDYVQDDKIEEDDGLKENLTLLNYLEKGKILF